jgi:hypothetical protein
VMLSFAIFVVSTIAFISQEIEKRKTLSGVDKEIFKWYALLCAF